MAKKLSMSPEDQKKEALETALAAITKKYGKGAIMKMSDHAVVSVPVIPTGSIGIDMALGIGGIPRGRVSEIFGPESSGKTTLTLHIIAEAQKMGLTCAFIDAEHALDIQYAHNLGVNTDDLMISQPDYGEQALDIANMLVASGSVGLIVVDSVAALVPQAELTGDMGATQVGGQARLMSSALRRLTGSIHRSQCAVIFINQIRMKIGMMAPGASPEVTAGGNALKFYASIRLDIRRGQQIKESKDSDSIGARTFVRIKKNKLAPPFKSTSFDMIFGRGISRAGELIDYGVEAGVIDKSGSWFSYKGEKLGQGRERIRTMLDEDQGLRASLENDVMEFLGKNSDAEPVDSVGAGEDLDAETARMDAAPEMPAAQLAGGDGSPSPNEWGD